MKMLLGAALCLALLIPSGPASAELLKNLKLDGGLDVRAVSGDGLLFLNDSHNADHIGTVQERVLLNAHWDVLDDVHATVTLRKNDRVWGTAGGSAVNTTNTGNQALVGTENGDTGIASNVVVQQANVKIDKVFGAFDTTIGRQYYGDPGDFVIHYGPKGGYGMYVSAIDAFRVDNENDWVKWSGLAGQTVGDNNAAFTTTLPATPGACSATGDSRLSQSNLANPCFTQDVTGVDTWIKNLPVKFGPFLWWRQTHLQGMSDNLFLYGARLRAEGMGFWLSADAGANAGENRSSSANSSAGTVNAVPANYDGYAFQVKAGYKADMPNVATVSPWATLAVGTGRSAKTDNQNRDFQSISNSPTYGFINGYFHNAAALNLGAGVAPKGVTYDGVTGIAKTGNGNREVFGFGAKVTPAAVSKLTVGAAFWDYWYEHATSAAVGSSPVALGNRHIGSEADLSAEWKHSDNVSFMLQVGKYWDGGFVNELYNEAHNGTIPNASLTGAGPSGVLAAQLDTNIRF